MFLDTLDIAKRVCQHCEAATIQSIDEDSLQNLEISFAYDKVRRAELRRNIWRFAIKKAVLRPIDADTMILDPAQWSSTTTYFKGAIVADANNQIWISLLKDNLNNTPGGNNLAWDTYFGPMTVYPYDATGTTAYYAGELVYVGGGTPPAGSSVGPVGSYAIYQSLTNVNSNVPNSGGVAWSATKTYHSDQTVTYGGYLWYSLIEVNLDNTPTTGPAQWGSTTSYSLGASVTGSDQFQYTSVGNANVGNNPVTDDGTYWTPTDTVTAWAKIPANTTGTALNLVTDQNWQPIQSAMHNLTFQWPIGTGPTTQSETRNIFRLPAGYLKEAPQDPKAGSVSFLGAPSGMSYNDWVYEGDYIISRWASPILYRFVADITNVQKMDDMFCEGLACRVATAVAPRLSQSNVKLQTIASAYALFMNEARRANAIEIGPIEPPEDDFVVCRY